MASHLEALEIEALKLTAEERARLADHLLASLAEGAEIDAAWAVEVDRRIAEIEEGRSQLTPAADVVARARDALK